jgi:hypothetical protein
LIGAQIAIPIFLATYNILVFAWLVAKILATYNILVFAWLVAKILIP